MNKDVRIAMALMGVLALTGCASAPKHYDVTRSRTYDASYDQVWARLIALLAKSNTPLKEIAKDSGVIYVEALRFDERQADCGSPGILKPIARFASVNILVQPVGNQQVVTVNSRFVETRYNSLDYSSSQVECNSKGQFEAAILNAIGPAARPSATSTVSPQRQPAVATARSVEEQIDELNRQQLPYEEYQRRYREIMGQ
ncbi:hypothetical protein [Pseudomonas sp. 273]|uniref:hypothetical protein n=1 Tax=Pseudomonas sp. 273 TaxID=75692 RepID=UPI0023D8A338|nr:hypothetical protein [Pseudomonas sp. 273]